MAEITCPTCSGAGRIEHNCHPGDARVISEIYRIDEPGFIESLTIRRCRVCGQLWKVFHQHHAGNTISIWLKPGENSSGMVYNREGTKSSMSFVFLCEEAVSLIDQSKAS